MSELVIGLPVINNKKIQVNGVFASESLAGERFGRTCLNLDYDRSPD
jgi:hypothetical protein